MAGEDGSHPDGAAGGQDASRTGRTRRWRRWRIGLAALVLAGLATWWLFPSTASPYPKGPVTIATGVHNGVYERYGQMLGPDIRKALGVDVRLVPTAGSVENLDRTVPATATFTIAAADAVADYAGRPGSDQLRACARLYDDYIQLIVKRDSPVRSTADLKGLRVGVGQRGSGVYLIATRLLRAAGLVPDRQVTAAAVGIDRAPQLLRDGKLDAFFWSGGLPTAAVTRLAKEFPIRLVPLGELVQPLRKIEGRSPSLYRSAVMPGDAYPDAYPKGAAISTIAVANLLVTTERTDAALVEGVTRTVIDSRDRIGAQVHAAQRVDLRTAIYTDPLPLHEGARRYYRSVKP